MDPTKLIASSAATDGRFVTTRKDLDQLGYHQTLGIESLPLAEKLLNDLIRTTESFRALKAETTHLQQLSKTLEKSVEPYKKENGRLLTENNRFQQQLIIQKEKWESALKAQKSNSKRTEQENAELRFLNSQYLHKVGLLEKESHLKSEQILQLQEKNLQAVVQTPGGRKQAIAFRRQRMEIDVPLPKALNVALIPQVQEQTKDVYVADMLRIADQSIQHLQQRATELTEKLEDYESQLVDCRKQVEVRDVEIKRLNKLLEDGRQPVALVTQSEPEKDTSDISFLLEHIQARNLELEKEVEELMAEKRIASRKRTVGWQKDSKTSVKTVHFDSDKRNVKEKKIEEELWEQLKDAKQSIASLKNTAEKDQRKVLELERKLTNKDEELAKLEKLIQEIHKDKDGLVAKVKELSSNERELLLEIDRLTHGTTTDAPHPDTMDSLLEYVRRLEMQRDQYKEEVRALLRLVQSGKGKSGETAGGQNDLLKVLEEERNFYKKQYEELLDEAQSRERRRAPSGAVSTIDRGTSAVDADFEDLRQEKADLESLVQALNNDLHQAQEQVAAVLQEKEDMFSRLQRVSEEMSHLRSQIASKHLQEVSTGTAPSTSQYGLNAQQSSADAVKERDEALGKLKQLQEQHSNLTEELQVLSRKYDFEKIKLQERISTLEIQLTECKVETQQLQDIAQSRNGSIQTILQERDTLQVEVNKIRESFQIERQSLERTINQMQAAKMTTTDPARADDSSRLLHLETQIVSLQYQISHLQDEIKQLRTMVENGDRRSEELQSQMKKKEDEMALLKETERDQNRRILEMQQIIEVHREDIVNLQQFVATMEEQRHRLSEGSRDQGQQISDLHYEVAVKESEAQSLKLAMSSMEGIMKNLQQKVEEKDREIIEAQKISETKQKDTESLSNDKESLQRENRRLLEDLTYMTGNHQKTSEQLEAVINERDTLHRQIQEYVTEVARVQELLSIKEKERQELLQQYCHLSEENNLLESQNKELEIQNSSTHNLLLNKDSELKTCQEAISSLEQEIQEHMASQASYNMQVSTLNTSMNEMEVELHSSREEVERLRKELSVTQQLCTTLETSKSKLHQQLATGHTDKDQLSTRLYELSEEMSKLREQLAISRSSVGNLEELLVSTREREFRAQISKQQLSAELEVSDTRLKEAENKLENQSREISSLRSKLSQLEIELDKMKRQLTNEKFERERASQELRRFRQQFSRFGTSDQTTLMPSSVRFAETTTSQSRITTSERLAATFHSSSSGFVTGHQSEQESSESATQVSREPS